MLKDLSGWLKNRIDGISGYSLKYIIITLLGALLLSFTFLVFNNLIIIAYIPLFYLIEYSIYKTRLIFIYYFIFYLISFYWLSYFTNIAPLVLGLCYAFLYSLFIHFLVIKRENHRLLKLIVLLVILDIIRAIGSFGLPFLQPAENFLEVSYFYGLIKNLGTYGTNLYIYLLNLTIFFLFRGLFRIFFGTAYTFRINNLLLQNGLRYCIILIILLLIPYIFKHQNNLISLNKSFAVTLIQPNFDENIKTNQRLNELNKIIGESEEGGLIVLPETVFQTSLNDGIKEFIKKLNSRYNAVIFGCVLDENNKSYNAIFYFNGDAMNSYPKFHLVPFGEYIPFNINFLLKLDWYKDWSPFDRGNNENYFLYNNLYLVSTVCFESSFDYLIRDRVYKLYNENKLPVLLTLTNDGWAKSRTSHLQHFKAGLLRCIEFGISWIRCGNSGITGLYRPDVKNEVDTLNIMKRDIKRFETNIIFMPSFYLKYFYYINFIILAFSILILLL
ncbi:MAG: apolipoprotein N-acyltransferase [Candidatus Hydrogenedentota bacterium]